MPPRNHEQGSIDLAEEVGTFVHEPIDSVEPTPEGDTDDFETKGGEASSPEVLGLDEDESSVDMSGWEVTYTDTSEYFDLEKQEIFGADGASITEMMRSDTFAGTATAAEHFNVLNHFISGKSGSYESSQYTYTDPGDGVESTYKRIITLEEGGIIRAETFRELIHEGDENNEDEPGNAEPNNEASDEIEDYDFEHEVNSEKKIEEPLLVFDLNEVFLSQIAEMNVGTEAVTEQVVQDEESHTVEAELPEQSAQSIAPVQQTAPKNSRSETIVTKNVVAPVIEMVAVQKMEVVKMDSNDESLESQVQPIAPLEQTPLTIDAAEDIMIAADIENVVRHSEEVFDTVPVHIEIAAAPHEVPAVRAEAIVPPIMVEQHSAIIGELDQKSDSAPKSEKNNEAAQGAQGAIVEKQEVAKPIESKIVSAIVETRKDAISVHSERMAPSIKREEAVVADSVAASVPVVQAEISARVEINDTVDAIPVAVFSENKMEGFIETVQENNVRENPEPMISVQEQELAQEIILVAANNTVTEPVQKISAEPREFLDEIFISNMVGENVPQAISSANNNEGVRRAYSNAQAATEDQNDSRETATPALQMNGITLQRLAIAA